jgi:hypothetical protein
VDDLFYYQPGIIQAYLRRGRQVSRCLSVIIANSIQVKRFISTEQPFFAQVLCAAVFSAASVSINGRKKFPQRLKWLMHPHTDDHPNPGLGGGDESWYPPPLYHVGALLTRVSAKEIWVTRETTVKH